MTRFRVLTFNCLFRGAARERLDAVARLLDKSDIDLLCLQEVTQRRNVRLLESRLASYGPADYRPLAGVAVKGGLVNLGRGPIERSSYEVFKERGPRWTLGWADRLLAKGFLTSSTRLDGAAIVIVNTHVLANYDEDWAPGNRFAREQRKDLMQLADAVNRLDTEAFVIVAGDFNVPSPSPMLDEFAAACGLRDAFDSASGPAPATMRPTGPGQVAHVLDHILYRHPPGLQVQVSACLRFVEPVTLATGRSAYASDHIAVEAAFDVELARDRREVRL
jgi:endonuclease/exonuclease/phosphatase family metal-dependent hydrolase